MYSLTLQLNARLQPLDRGDIYEDYIIEVLEENGVGSIDGGGTLLQENGEVEYCDIEITLEEGNEESIEFLLEVIEAIQVPKGSLLYNEDVKYEVGTLEGLALYMNGTDLPDEVYRNCDINVVIEKLEELLEDSGEYYSYWEGPQDTALYFYGDSYEKMKKIMEPFLREYPLCQKCRVVQIA